MKGPLAVAFALLAHGVSATQFGPHNCVSLARSSEGSCVMTTDCEGQDISKTEFAFNCIGKTVVRHSFGVGGFDTNEEFDSDVKCDRCTNASPVGTKLKKTAKAVKHVEVPAAKAAAKPAVAPAKAAAVAGTVNLKVASKAASSAKSEWTPPWSSNEEATPEAVKYGPNGCVSVWREPKEGHCIMSTKCKKSDITNYEFGLVCIDKVGSPVKHLFGKDSFDPEEKFDTLIKCKECLGLEDIPDAITLAGEVATLQKNIHNLNAVMSNISINVQMLNDKVFKPAPGGAPAPAAAAAPAAAKDAKPVKFLAQHHRHHHRRHHHHRHHRRHYYDDDDEAEEDDEEALLQTKAKPVAKK